jgi:hypothetical protein
MALLEHHHFPCQRKRTRLQPAQVHTAGHMRSSGIRAIPDNPVPARHHILIQQNLHEPAEHIKELKTYASSFRKCKRNRR